VANRQHLREARIHAELRSKKAHHKREGQQKDQDRRTQTEYEIFNTLQNNLPVGSAPFCKLSASKVFTLRPELRLFFSFSSANGTTRSFCDASGDTPRLCLFGPVWRSRDSAFLRISQSSSPGTGGFNYHDMPLWHSLIVEKFEADSGFFMTKALKLHVLLEQSALILLTRRRTLG